MIKIFRKIRLNLLSKGKTGKYFKYAVGEIILVVIGILIALFINNWNEERKRKLEEITVLNGIKNALKSDLTNEFDKHILMNKIGLTQTDSLLNYINNNLTYVETLSSYLPSFSTTLRKNWTPNTSAYKILESKGLDIVKNDSLLKNILNIYNKDYPRITMLFDNYLQNLYDYGRPLLRQKFVFSNGNFKPLNPDSILKDSELINTININKINLTQHQASLELFRKNVENVINQIESEIKK